MTETEWATCRDPIAMLDFVRASGKLSGRKARLFAVAVCRRTWHLLANEKSRSAVEVAEGYADGTVGKDDLRLAEQDAKAAIPSISLDFPPSLQAAAAGAVAVVTIDATVAAKSACGWVENVRLALAFEGRPADLSRTKDKAVKDWGAEAASLLRCIFANPFRLPRALAPSLLTSDVLAQAHLAYEERKLPEGTLDPARLATLADALAAAGCTDAELLGHLGGAGAACPGVPRS